MQGRVVPEYSQERKVQEALYQAGVSHNAGVVAHLTNIHVDAHGTVYFCHSTLAVAAEVAPGDGGVLPRRVTLEGSWDFPAPGFYDFHNARIDINGTISIRRTEQTALVRGRQPASTTSDTILVSSRASVELNNGPVASVLHWHLAEDVVFGQPRIISEVVELVTGSFTDYPDI